MLRRSAAELEGVLVGAAALVALLLMDAYVRDSPEPANDELVYELMAREPFDPHTFPFAYRVAVPTLVNVLPFSHETSFSALAWLFTAACATLAYVLLRRFEIGKPLAAVTVGAFLAMNVGYAIYMEDFDGAQEGIIEVEPSPFEIR